MPNCLPRWCIYPKWATIVQTIKEPSDRKKAHFAKTQEALCKDIERAFGVLQARFAIVKGPARFWDQEDLYYIMQTCVILHNMIIEHQHDEEDDEAAELLRERPFNVSRERTRPIFMNFLVIIRKYDLLRCITSFVKVLLNIYGPAKEKNHD